MLTNPPAAYLADLLGRKKAVASGTIVILLGMVLQGEIYQPVCKHDLTISTVVPGVTQGMYIGGRFLVGLG